MWTKFQHINENDSEEVTEQKKFYNSILLDRYPYFFIYRYTECRREFKEYRERAEITCKQKFGCSLDELERSDDLTEEQKALLANYYRYMPVIMSNSPMNLICRRIEKLAKEVSDRAKLDEFDYTILKYKGVEYGKAERRKVINEVKKFLQARKESAVAADCTAEQSEYMWGYLDSGEYTESMLIKVLPDMRVTVNVLVDYFYRDNPRKSRDLLWGVFGKYLLNNLKGDTVSLPLPDNNGEIEYLGDKYSIAIIKNE